MTTNEPALTTRAEQPYVAIPIEVSLREWGLANALVPEVFGWLAQRAITPAGPLFYRYHVIGDMDAPFSLEVGVPITMPVAGDARLTAGSIPAGTYATITHDGHPDQQFRAHRALADWAVEHGITWASRTVGEREVWGGRFEYYLTNPAVEPDPSTWSMEISYLVRDAG